MKLEPVAGVRGHERAASSVFLDAKVPQLRAGERRDEIVLVEGESEVIDARQLPLARLHDDIDGAAFELRQPELEAHLVEVLPAVAGLERRRLLADPAVPCDEREAELADVAGLDLAHLARHQVVM